MKPSVFVGSSTEALGIARAVQQNLEPDVDVELWTQGVASLSKTVLHGLLKAVRRHDYSVFVFATDDVLLLRDHIHMATRDNVMFEMGMFISVLGPDRCFFLVPTNASDFRIPTDLAGIIPAQYDSQSHSGNLRAALGASCTNIMDAIRNGSRLSGIWFLYIGGSLHQDANGTMFITCAGERATARLSLRVKKDGGAVARDFFYEGRYVAGQFAMTFAQTDADDQIVGSIAFRASADRLSMAGQTLFWHHDIGRFVTTEFSLYRNPLKQ